MNIQQIEYVIAVHELKNFGQAAERCFITQSTLSTMVARFEDEIGITIFDRKTKPVTTTQEGQQVVRQLKIIAKEIDSLHGLVSTLKGKVTGELKIGVIPTVAPYLLPLFLNEFARNYPKVHFAISEITTEQIVDSLDKRELDIGIVSIPLQIDNLVEIPLYDEPFLLFDKTDDTPRSDFQIDEIDFDRLWLLEEGHCMRTQVESICGLQKKRTADRNLDYRSGSIDSLLKFVNRNRGTTLLPYLATRDFPDDDRQHLKQFRTPVPSRTIGLLVHEHFVKKEILDALQTAIQDKIRPLIGEGDANRMIVAPV